MANLNAINALPAEQRINYETWLGVASNFVAKGNEWLQKPHIITNLQITGINFLELSEPEMRVVISALILPWPDARFSRDPQQMIAKGNLQKLLMNRNYMSAVNDYLENFHVQMTARGNEATEPDKQQEN